MGKYAEEKPFYCTLVDVKPQVFNLAGGSHDVHSDMLRIGNWDKLDNLKWGRTASHAATTLSSGSRHPTEGRRDKHCDSLLQGCYQIVS